MAIYILYIYIYIYIYIYAHTYIHMYVHTYVHTYIHTYIHTYTHTYIKKYIHTYIYMPLSFLWYCTTYVTYVQRHCRLFTAVHVSTYLAFAITAFYTFERPYVWPPPSVSRLYFLFRASASSSVAKWMSRSESESESELHYGWQRASQSVLLSSSIECLGYQAHLIYTCPKPWLEVCCEPMSAGRRSWLIALLGL